MFENFSYHESSREPTQNSCDNGDKQLISKGKHRSCIVDAVGQGPMYLSLAQESVVELVIHEGQKLKESKCSKSPHC